MTELSGTLEGVGLPQLVGFLAGLGKSGRLVVADGPLSGTLDLDGGAIVGASFGQETGQPALEAITLALGNGQFTFSDAVGGLERNLSLPPEEVRRNLEHMAHEQASLAAVIPSLAAIPRVAVDEGTDQGEVALDRDTLRLLLALDGRRSVADLARERGLLRTLRQIARLAELGLAQLEMPAAPSGDVSAPRAVSGAAVSEATAAGRAPAPEASQPSQAPPGPARPQRGGQERSGEPTWPRWRRPTSS